jgi:hypothetical protein
MVGISILGVFALGLTLQGSPVKQKSVDVQKGVAGNQAAQVASTELTVIGGPGIPKAMHGKLRVLPPVVVDYRNDDMTRDREAGVFFPTTGRIASAGCALNEECNDCNPCTEDLCVTGNCTNTDYEDNAIAPDCDDGLYCNGGEVCVAGVCAPSDEPPCYGGGLGTDVCDEQDDDCVDPCTSVASCDDTQNCTTEVCVNRCEGGADHGVACTTPGVPGGCALRCVETCVYTEKNCGVGGVCMEAGGGVCTTGRCCDTTTWACSDVKRDDCTGQWLGVTDCVEDPPYTCPKYGSGVIDGSNVNWQFPNGFAEGVVTVAPVSGLACDVLNRVGDDYMLDITEEFLEIQRLRFVGGVMLGPDTRFSIELRDADGNLIEDTWYLPLSDVEGGPPQVHTLTFNPTLIIPKSGIVSMSVQTDFSPGGRIYWLSTDFAGRATNVNRGTNDERRLYVNGTRYDDDFLGQCNGGSRDGQWCDMTGTIIGCPGGTCDDVDDIMAFEIIGKPYLGNPEGACCDVVAGTCAHTLPWACGGKFRGVGTVCALCTDPLDPSYFDPCDDDGDCGGTPGQHLICLDQVCDQTLDPCDTDDDCEEVGEICINLATACATQACCETATGLCSELVGTGQTCPSGTTSLDFASDCTPNCCEQPLPRGGRDNCNLAATEDLAIINLVGYDVTTVTLTGDNSTATYDDFTSEPPWCDNDIFDPDGETKDPGWWHAFSIDDCAYVRIELCCSDPVVRPQWAGLFSGCPCDTGPVYGQVGVKPPIGDGEDTAGHARGLPFCDDDNTWGTYGPLPAGTYYIPIYSAPNGNCALPGGCEYQLNIYAARCPSSQCCYLECNNLSTNPGARCVSDEDCLGSDSGRACIPTCAWLDTLACDELDGWWIPDIAACGTGVCDTGACCVGPGDCEDTVPGGPMTMNDCETLDGRYWGGAECVAFGEPNDPCPVCPIDDPITCTRMEDYPNVPGWIVYFADTSVEDYELMHRADDFVATDTAVSEVCVWGSWIDRNDNVGRRDCACVNGEVSETGCPTRVQDNFRVCVWTDDNRKPGTLVGCSSADHISGLGPVGTTFDVWLINLDLLSPIGPLSPDATYWIDVTNNTVNDPGCTWYWNGGNQGDPDYGDIINANNWSYVTWEEETWEAEEYEVQDMTWCIDAGIPPAAETAPEGACCTCEPFLWTVETAEECEVALGSWLMGETCTPNPCPTGLPDGDLRAGALPAVEGDNDFSNKCATTAEGADPDGHNPVVCEGASSKIGRDVWFEHIATKTDLATFDFCANVGWDGILAIYSNGGVTCPAVPSAGTMVACNDEDCVSSGGPPRLSKNLTQGVCYLLRVGGWVDATETDLNIAAQTAGPFSITYGPVECPYPVPAAAVGDLVIPKRVKHLTFSAPGGETRTNAVRVKLTASTQFPSSVGKSWYVGQPREVSETAGTSGPGPTPPRYWAATLQVAPYFTNWSQIGTPPTAAVISVYGREIAPGCTYEIALVPDGCEMLEPAYSIPLVVQTSKWGDVVGATYAAPPQGIVNFDDISSVVAKFKNVAGAPAKARADIASGTPCMVDQTVSFVDISNVVDAFTGKPYNPACAP